MPGGGRAIDFSRDGNSCGFKFGFTKVPELEPAPTKLYFLKMRIISPVAITAKSPASKNTQTGQPAEGVGTGGGTGITQAWVSSDAPMQSFPPLEGVGFVQVRMRRSNPATQSLQGP